jgi:hypothetical protein
MSNDISLTRGARRRLALPLAAMALSLPALLGCQGFYVMHPVSLASQVTTPPAPVQKPLADPLDPAPLPYLTLTMHTHSRSFFASTEAFDPSLQVFKFDIQFTPPGAAQPVNFSVMAFDLKNKLEHGLIGHDVVRAMPIDATGAPINITFSSSAVEKTVADQFLKVFDVAKSVAGPILGAATGPEATLAIDTVGSILDQFKSDGKPMTSTRSLTLNPASGNLESQRNALIFVPTGGVGSSEALPASGAPQDPSLPAVANTSEYLRRLEKLGSMKFVVCAADPKALCTIDASSKETPFELFAYVLVVPTITYRVTFDGFLWKNLQPGGNCAYEVKDVDAYEAALGSHKQALTATQMGAEQEILLGAKSLRDLRMAISQDKAGVVFKVFDAQWSKVVPKKKMFTLVDVYPSYQSKLNDLRSCMLREGNGFRDGVFYAYTTMKDASREADEIGAAPPPGLPAAEIAKVRLENYEKALRYLDGLSSNLERLKIDEAGVKAQLAYDKTRLESEVEILAFRGPIKDLGSSDAATREAASKVLKQLLGGTNCESCRKEAKDALDAFAAGPSRGGDGLLRAAENLASARGTIEVAKIINKLGAKDTRIAEQEKAVREAEQKLRESVDSRQITDVETAGRDAANARRGAEKLLQ